MCVYVCMCIIYTHTHLYLLYVFYNICLTLFPTDPEDFAADED